MCVGARFIKQLKRILSNAILAFELSTLELLVEVVSRSRTRSSSSSSFAWIHPFSHYAPIATTRDNEIAHATKFISFSRDRTSVSSRVASRLDRLAGARLT